MLGAAMAWRDQGACALPGVNPDWFYPEKADSQPYERARRLCHRCPVLDDCRIYALEHNERHGMWGGWTPRQRWMIRRERGITAHALRDFSPAVSEQQARATWQAARASTIQAVARDLGVSDKALKSAWRRAGLGNPKKDAA